MSIVRNLGDDTALVDATLTGYSETPVTGVGGASPYASVKVNGVETARIGGVAFTQLSAQGAGVNVPLVLTPKGSGALSAHVADGTAVGGSTRGANAVDWQMLRGSAARVASGAYATIGGGDSNQALNTGSTVAGGSNNFASGIMSWSPGGQYGDARSIIGRGVWGSGRFSANGDAQSSELCLRRQTTDGSTVTLTSDNIAPSNNNQLILPNNCVAGGHVFVTVRALDGTFKAMYKFQFLARRDGNAASTLVSSNASTPITAGTPGTAAVALAQDTTNGGLAVNVTGDAGKTINWFARVMWAEVVG